MGHLQDISITSPLMRMIPSDFDFEAASGAKHILDVTICAGDQVYNIRSVTIKRCIPDQSDKTEIS